MNERRAKRIGLWLAAALLMAGQWLAVAAAGKNLAVVVAPGSKLQDVPAAELAKLYKGTEKTWPDGKNFLVVVHDQEAPEIKAAFQRLFGVGTAETKAVSTGRSAKAEGRVVVKVVGSDEDVLRTVAATPGAIGLVDVYSINSTVKVLRVDGKLPFDPGYVLKGNQAAGSNGGTGSGE